MPAFPSEDWVQAFCDAFMAHPDAAVAASELEGVYRFVIEPAGPLRERHAYDVAISPDGEGGAAARVQPAGERVRLELRADYPNWRRLVSGQLDVGMAVMFRRLRVSGDLSGLTRKMSSTRPLTEALGKVDTQWLDA